MRIGPTELSNAANKYAMAKFVVMQTVKYCRTAESFPLQLGGNADAKNATVYRKTRAGIL